MQQLNLVFLVLGIIALLESLVILFFPKTTARMTLKLAKNPKTLMKIGLAELVIAIVLILIALVLN